MLVVHMCSVRYSFVVYQCTYILYFVGERLAPY